MDGDTKGDIVDDGKRLAGGRVDTADDGVYPFYTTVRNASLDTAARELLEDDSDANLYAVRNRNADVTFMAATTTIDADAPAFVDHVEYSAASKQDITFRFSSREHRN